MSDSFISFAKPSIGEEEIQAVVECLRSGWLTTGPIAKKFEEEFADAVGARHAVAVNSCTAGLHLALEAIGVGPGDEVIAPSYTFTATAEVIRYLGADPVLVDIEPDTLNIDPAAVARALGARKRVKAIVLVHFAGRPCDMAELDRLAKRYGVKLIEDAAHAFPAAYRGRRIGSIGDATVFSFYATKTITTGEGGMLVTDDGDIAARARVMRLHGISRDVFARYTSKSASWYYEVVAAGFKYNMPDMLAALGRVQLRRAEAMRQERERIAHRYTQGLASLPLRLPPACAAEDVHAWHLYVARLDLERWRIVRDTFIERMFDAGVGVSVHFIPLHVHPYWRDTYRLSNEDFPVATAAFTSAVSLPIYPGLTDAQIDRVIQTVHSIHGAQRETAV